MYRRRVRGRCPVDGVEDAVCGPAAPITSVDARGEVVDVQDGGPLQVYEVESGGVKLRLRLSEADARKRGLPTEPEPETAQATAAAAPAKTRKTSARNKKRTVEPEATGGE